MMSDQMLDFTNVGSDSNSNPTNHINQDLEASRDNSMQVKKGSGRGKSKDKTVNISHKRSTKPKIINLDSNDRQQNMDVSKGKKKGRGRERSKDKNKFVEIDNNQGEINNFELNDEQKILDSVKMNIKEVQNDKRYSQEFIRYSHDTKYYSEE